MKKLVSMLLAALLILSSFGCGPNAQDSSKTQNSSKESQESSSASVSSAESSAAPEDLSLIHISSLPFPRAQVLPAAIGIRI